MTNSDPRYGVAPGSRTGAKLPPVAATSVPEVAQAPDESEKGFKYVLSQPAFRLIWFAQVAAQLADKFLMFSLVILAYRLSGSSTSVATTLVAYTLPSVFIAPAAGVF